MKKARMIRGRILNLPQNLGPIEKYLFEFFMCLRMIE